MSRYDKDIDENPYLDEQGKHLAQYAREHGITTPWSDKPVEEKKRKRFLKSGKE